MQRTPFQPSARVAARIVALTFFAGLMAVVSSPPAAAQDLHTYTVNVFGGIGGAFDIEPDAGLENDSYQIGFNFTSGPRNYIGARLGQLDFSGEEGFGIFSEADLSYLTIGGEFRNRKDYYDSGLYIALGGYRLEGTTPFGESQEDTALGLALGTTADFPINRWLSILAELSGHITDLDQAQFFGMLHLGVSVRF